MKILAFDTATERLAVGLHAAGRDWLHEAPGGAAASAALLPAARALLRQAGLDWRDLDAVAFGRGPGAFTGLRTSCAVAQGLGLGLGCPLLPLDSLLVVAEDARAQCAAAGAAPADIGVAMDARIGEIYAARWRWAPDRAGAECGLDCEGAGEAAGAGSGGGSGRGAHGGAAGGADESADEGADEGACIVAGGGADAGADSRTAGGTGTPAQGPWRALMPPALLGPQALAAAWARQPPQAVAGSALAVFGPQLALPPGVTLVPQEHARAAALLRLALAAWRAGAGVDAAQALPLYLRDKVAQTTAERLAMHPARGAGPGPTPNPARGAGPGRSSHPPRAADPGRSPHPPRAADPGPGAEPVAPVPSRTSR